MGGGGPLSRVPTLRVRWLGRVAYRDALVLQRRLHRHSSEDHLLLLEHRNVITLGRRGRREHLLCDAEALGAEVVCCDRGGDITYHGPGQLVGYPILTVPGRRGGGMADTVGYVRSLEQLLIEVVSRLGLPAGRVDRHPGVWIDPQGPRPRKIAAIGVRLSRARSMHGFALNVSTDLTWFDRIVPCGISHLGVTSLAAEGVDIAMSEVTELMMDQAEAWWASQQKTSGVVDRAAVAHRVSRDDLAAVMHGSAGAAAGAAVRTSANLGRGDTSSAAKGCPGHDGSDGTSPRLLARLAQAQAQLCDPAGASAVATVPLRARKPDWLKVPLSTGPTGQQVRSTLRDLDLVTVCEEAGCPNLAECWNDGTATFMILGERCTRACGFCMVDTRRPRPVDESEPQRLAEAVARMGLEHVVVTMVARDDLPDGGAGAMVAVLGALRERVPQARVETLISDLGGDEAALSAVFAARPDVLAHNIETVPRLQRAVRPSAGYARSLAVLARAAASGLVTKSSLIVGMGETDHEITQTLVDLHAAGARIVTIGQYLRPSSQHLPVVRWWEPAAFARWKEFGEALGMAHVEASPLTRSSYHARAAAASAGAVGAGPAALAGAATGAGSPVGSCGVAR